LRHCFIFVVAATVIALGQPLLGSDPGPIPCGPSVEQVAAPKDLNELRGIEQRVEKVVAKVLPATVGVTVGQSQGSGVIVSKNGLVLTAGHVCGKPGQPVTFLFADGKTAKGTTLGIFHGTDAGMMKITDKGDWPAIEKGRSAELKIGSWCVAVGHPLGFQKGRPPVARVGRLLRAEPNVLQTDCPIVAGDSGGPVFDLDGRVIAISSRIGASTEQNLHVPVDVFTQNWDRLVKGDLWDTTLPSRDSDAIKSVVRPIVAEAARSVVRIKCDGKETALGTIVGPHGWVLTKASELGGKVVCRLADQRELEAHVVGINKAFDLAMLKVETTGMPTVAWFSHDVTVGQWVVSPAVGDRPVSLGIISVPRRTIPPIAGKMGVLLADGDGGARIESLLPQGAAERAGLKPRDVITHVDGRRVANRKEAGEAVARHRPGEAVKIGVKRDKEAREFTITLYKPDTPATRKRDMQNESGVGVSRRADDFADVFQHDTVLRPADCGGPLVDLNGRVIGVNIARAGRTETYSLPTDVLLPLMYDLMSGRLAPPEKPATEPAKPAAEKEKKDSPPPKPAEQKQPVTPKPVEQKPVEQKPVEQKPVEQKPAEQHPSAPKPVEQKPIAPKPSGK
jgi:serine protease Do